MSHLAEREITCPACKQPVTAEVWSSINVREDPELKDLLLGGEINIVECDACKEPFHVDAFVLYHDPDNEIMAFVFPMDEELELDVLGEKVAVDFEATQATLPDPERVNYEPVCMKGLNDLVTFVEQDEEVGLQGEVLEAIAKQHGLPMVKLRPWIARRQNLPRVLPVSGDGAAVSSDSLLAGLRALKGINDRLTVYNQTLDRLAGEPAQSIQLS